MTVMEFFGCTFIAFGPPLGLFIFTIARDPLRIIVLIASAFFWLLSLLISSILWYAVVPLRQQLAFGLVFSVLFQETFRFLFYKLLRKADRGLQQVSQTGQNANIAPKDISNKNIMAYGKHITELWNNHYGVRHFVMAHVSGLGFGIICGAFSLVNVLADMWGPGTIGIKGDSQYFFVASAFLTLCFVFLHTFWGVIFFYAWDKRHYLLIAVVLCSHMLVSCLTLLNQRTMDRSEPLYLASIIPAYIVMFTMAVIAFYTAGGSFRNIMAAVSCKTSSNYIVD